MTWNDTERVYIIRITACSVSRSQQGTVRTSKNKWLFIKIIPIKINRWIFVSELYAIVIKGNLWCTGVFSKIFRSIFIEFMFRDLPVHLSNCPQQPVGEKRVTLILSYPYMKYLKRWFGIRKISSWNLFGLEE